MLFKRGEVTAQLKSIFRTATDGIIIIDERGVILEVNDAVTNLFLYDYEELIGQKVNLLMTKHDREHHDEYLDKYHKTGERKIIGIGREVVGRRKDGSTFPLRLAVSEVKDTDRRMYTGMLHDLTDIHEAQEKVEELNEQLQQKVEERTSDLNKAVNQLLSTNKQMRQEIEWREVVEDKLREREKQLEDALSKERELGELKTRFVSMASHEFRTPLATILSSASILSKYTETDQQPRRNKHIDRIKDQVKNMNSVLEDFLSLSKLESGRIDLEVEAVQINALCRGVVADMHGLMKPGQLVEHKIIAGNGIIHTDPRILKNVLYNIMSNAIKYSPENSTIHCRVLEVEDGYSFEVEDEGIGIPIEDQKHLFTRFFRAKNAINIQGTGLGLNIVVRYLNILNGDVSFKSEEGKGTTFFIKLPTNLEV